MPLWPTGVGSGGAAEASVAVPQSAKIDATNAYTCFSNFISPLPLPLKEIDGRTPARPCDAAAVRRRERSQIEHLPTRFGPSCRPAVFSPKADSRSVQWRIVDRHACTNQLLHSPVRRRGCKKLRKEA